MNVTPAIAERFATLRADHRTTLLHWRDLIYSVAGEDACIGALEESLKWNQPSYRPATTKSGTTVRLWLNKAGDPAIFVPCSTTIIDHARERFGDEAIFEGDRACVPDERTSEAALRALFHDALTYHLS